MSGKIIAILLVGFAAAFGAGFWYFQVHAFYARTEAEAVTIAGRDYPVAGWEGIDAASSPLKLRACFRLETVPEAPPAPDAEPLVAPFWFGCFDAEAISRALAAGEAAAFLAAAEEVQGVNRIVARFPDGRAYMWRQLTPEFANQ